MITYTTIIHQAREELGLSLHEYAILDIIYLFQIMLQQMILQRMVLNHQFVHQHQ